MDPPRISFNIQDVNAGLPRKEGCFISPADFCCSFLTNPKGGTHTHQKINMQKSKIKCKFLQTKNHGIFARWIYTYKLLLFLQDIEPPKQCGFLLILAMTSSLPDQSSLALQSSSIIYSSCTRVMCVVPFLPLQGMLEDTHSCHGNTDPTHHRAPF